jgi:hypothetical protein
MNGAKPLHLLMHPRDKALNHLANDYVEREQAGLPPRAVVGITKDNQALASKSTLPQPRFKLETAEELINGHYSEPAWLVHDLIPQVGLGMRYGKSNVGKSFIALDAICAVTRGVEWCGRKAKKAKGCIVVGEGQHSYPLRLKAYAARYGVSPADMPSLIRQPVNLFVRSEVDELIELLRAAGGVQYLVVDTLATCTVGFDENSSRDMNIVIENCKRISSELECYVEITHHSGKDATRGARGSSALTPAMDVEMYVERIGEGGGLVSITKIKDAAGVGTCFAFKLVFQKVGTSARTGEGYGSLVVEWASQDTGAKGRRKKSRTGVREKAILAAMRELDPSGVHPDDVITRIAKMTGAKVKRSNYDISIANLIKTGELILDGESEYVRLAGVLEATQAEFDK